MTQPPAPHRHADNSPHSQAEYPATPLTRHFNVLAWPAWLRVLAVLPVVILLWLAVWWANAGAALW